jgi:hypothetical protein
LEKVRLEVLQELLEPEVPEPEVWEAALAALPEPESLAAAAELPELLAGLLKSLVPAAEEALAPAEALPELPPLLHAVSERPAASAATAMNETFCMCKGILWMTHRLLSASTYVECTRKIAGRSCGW